MKYEIILYENGNIIKQYDSGVLPAIGDGLVIGTVMLRVTDRYLSTETNRVILTVKR